jgi:hypothetical protein
MVKSSVVAVAQLVESRIVIPVVVGSSPISHPIIICFVVSHPFSNLVQTVRMTDSVQ